MRDLRTSIHGDNFSSLGARQDLEWFEAELTKVCDIKLEGLLGPPDEPDCDHQLATLNRLLTWTSSGIEWEADPRHVKIVLQALGLADCKGVSAPGVKEKTNGDVEEDEFLSDEKLTWYRSLSQRAAYLGQDRPDLGVACREMAKGMQHPTVRHVGILKHLGRYLKAHPRLAQVFRHQDQARVLHAWGDANHAGCIRTRKSTSGGSVMLGHHSVMHW